MTRRPGAPGGGELRFAASMTDVEALMWRLGESDPRMRATMTLAVVLDGPVDALALRDRIALVTEAVPRLRDRVQSGPVPSVPPLWEPDPAFSLGSHVHRARPARGRPPLDVLDVFEVAEDLVAAPFFPARPPWRAVYIPEIAEGRSALVLHLHHSYTDGLGGLRLAAELFDFEPAPVPRPGSAPGGPLAPEGSTLEAGPLEGGPLEVGPLEVGPLEVGLEAGLRRSLNLARRAVPWSVRSLSEAANDPFGPAAVIGELLDSLQGQLAALRSPASPAMTNRSAGVRLASLPLSLPALRRQGRRLGATVNDVFLSGLLGGLALYHEKHAVLPETLRMGIPISSRAGAGAAEPDGQEMHNQLVGALLRAPVGVRDFDERTWLIHEIVAKARSGPLSGLFEDLAGLALRLPGVPRAVASVIGSLDVLASNVPGPDLDLYLAGARVEQMIPFGPRSGTALNATLLSYRDLVFVGFNIDPAAVPDAPALLDCLGAGFEECLGG